MPDTGMDNKAHPSFEHNNHFLPFFFDSLRSFFLAASLACRSAKSLSKRFADKVSLARSTS